MVSLTTFSLVLDPFLCCYTGKPFLVIFHIFHPSQIGYRDSIILLLTKLHRRRFSLELSSWFQVWKRWFDDVHELIQILIFYRIDDTKSEFKVQHYLLSPLPSRSPHIKQIKNEKLMLNTEGNIIDHNNVCSVIQHVCISLKWKSYACPISEIIETSLNDDFERVR